MTVATDMRDKYIAAEAAVLGGQRYRWGDRDLTRADLSHVQAGRREWERKAVAESRAANGGGIKLANLSGLPGVPEGGEFDFVWQHG